MAQWSYEPAMQQSRILVWREWQQMTLSDVVIPPKVSDMAGGNLRHLA